MDVVFTCVLIIYIGNVKSYEQQFKDGDIESSFVFMLYKLNELWSDVDYSKLIDACLWDMRLSDELRNNLRSVGSLKGILDLLSETHFCTWLEIRILRSMADVAEVPEAIQIIDTFAQCVHSRKCSEVEKHFKKQYIIPNDYSLVCTRLNKDAKDLCVADLIEYCHNLESIIEQPKSSALVTGKTGLEVCLVVPKQWHFHAYEKVKSRFLKLRPFNIQYIQIGTLPKVFASDLTKIKETNLLLTKVSSHDNCKFKK